MSFGANAVDLNGGSIRDRAANDAVVAHAARAANSSFLVLQRRITKYDVLLFVLGCQRAIAVGSTHHVVRSKSAAKITLSDKPSL